VRWGLSALLALPILAIGFARIEDGAHWPSDVLGGYMLGWLWLAVTIQIYRWARRRLAERHSRARRPAALLAAPSRGVQRSD
jgi:membrane-associated phospholipid phosphatase